MNTEEFINKAIKIHGDKYDYSKCVYTKMREKVCIICPEHGEFWQVAYNHLHGHGCKKCYSDSKTLTLDTFIKRCRATHGDKYDYSKVDYKNNATKVCIICPEHGEFWQTPVDHLRNKGCPMCTKEENGYTTDKFIECAKKIHGDKYDYSKVVYKGINMKVCIICPEHGEFWQTPGSHLQGHGCKKCIDDKHRLTTSEFIKMAMDVHGEEYDYSKTQYVNCNTPVCVTCRKHGDFYVLPYQHLHGQKCKICSGEEVTTDTFIEKAKMVHGDKYDYSKVDYKNSHTKVCIICPEHGEFWQRPNGHLRGNGCPKCAGISHMTTENFISKSKEVHGDKYDYSKVDYVNSGTKVCIICPEHGEFWQTPQKHMMGSECPRCTHQSYPDTTDTFIEKAKKVHGDKYDYSKVGYKNSHTKVCVVCPEHGEFYVTPTNHLRGKECPKCALEKNSLNSRLTTDEFVEKAKKVHGDKYDYSKVDYVDSKTEVCIICPEHGEFWQKPNNHLVGSGCKRCHESRLEREIRVYLTNEHIAFETSKNFKWLKRQHLDFYLPEYNIGIECQGEQHFFEVERFKNPLAHVVEMDRKKNVLCKQNNLKLLYFTDEKIYRNIIEKPDFYNEIFVNKEDLLDQIKGT